MSPLFLGLSINGIVLSSDLIASDPFRFQATYRSAVPNIIGGSCDYVGIPRRTQVALTTQRGQHIPLKCLPKHCCVGGTWHRRSLSPLRMRDASAASSADKVLVIAGRKIRACGAAIGWTEAYLAVREAELSREGPGGAGNCCFPKALYVGYRHRPLS